jgi:hypothetical protein
LSFFFFAQQDALSAPGGVKKLPTSTFEVDEAGRSRVAVRAPPLLPHPTLASSRLASGDVLVKLDSSATGSCVFNAGMFKRPPNVVGSKCGGRLLNVLLNPANHTTTDGSSSSSAKSSKKDKNGGDLGLLGIDLEAVGGTSYGSSSGTSLSVSRVAAGSEAAAQGVCVGDLVVSIGHNGSPLKVRGNSHRPFTRLSLCLYFLPLCLYFLPLCRFLSVCLSVWLPLSVCFSVYACPSQFILIQSLPAVIRVCDPFMYTFLSPSFLRIQSNNLSL